MGRPLEHDVDCLLRPEAPNWHRGGRARLGWQTLYVRRGKPEHWIKIGEVCLNCKEVRLRPDLDQVLAEMDGVPLPQES